MNGQTKSGNGFGTLGIFLGIFVLIVSVVWIAIITVADDDPADEITWVG